MHEPWVHQLAPTRVFFIFSPIRCWIGFLKNILDLRSCTFFSTRPRLGKTDLHYTISYFIMSQVCTAVLLVVVIAHWREETVTWNSRMQNELSWVWCVLSRQTLDFASIYFSWAHKLLSFLRSAWILDHTKKAEVYRIGFTFLFIEPDISLALRSFTDHCNLHNNFRFVLLLSCFRDVERPQLISISTLHLIRFLVDIIHIY